MGQVIPVSQLASTALLNQVQMKSGAGYVYLEVTEPGASVGGHTVK